MWPENSHRSILITPQNNGRLLFTWPFLPHTIGFFSHLSVDEYKDDLTVAKKTTYSGLVKDIILTVVGA